MPRTEKNSVHCSSQHTAHTVHSLNTTFNLTVQRILEYLFSKETNSKVGHHSHTPPMPFKHLGLWTFSVVVYFEMIAMNLWNSFSVFLPVFPCEMSRLNIHQTQISFIFFFWCSRDSPLSPLDVYHDDWDAFPFPFSFNTEKKPMEKLVRVTCLVLEQLRLPYIKWMTHSNFYQHLGIFPVFMKIHSSLHHSYILSIYSYMWLLLYFTFSFYFQKKAKEAFATKYLSLLYVFIENIDVYFCCNQIGEFCLFLSVDSANVHFIRLMNKPSIDSDFILYAIMSPWVPLPDF